LSADDSTDDLNKPLGQTAKRRKRFVLPIPAVTRALAGILGLCVAVLAGWILFVDEPFGGEPMAVVSAVTAASPKTASGQGAAGKPDAIAPVALADGAKPVGNTVTIIDGTTGKRQEVTVGQPGALPQKKTELKSEARPDTKPDVPVDQRLLEASPHGAIPKIAPDGARPSDIYARPVKQQGSADTPRSHEARTIGAMSLTRTRRWSTAYGGRAVRSPISKACATGSTVRVSSRASVGAPFDGYEVSKS